MGIGFRQPAFSKFYKSAIFGVHLKLSPMETDSLETVTLIFSCYLKFNKILSFYIQVQKERMNLCWLITSRRRKDRQHPSQIMVKATNRILDTGVKTRQKVRKTDRNHVNDYSSVMFMIRMPSNIDKIRHCTASPSFFWNVSVLGWCSMTRVFDELDSTLPIAKANLIKWIQVCKSRKLSQATCRTLS